MTRSGDADKQFPPVSVDFGPDDWTLHNEQFLTSYGSACHHTNPVTEDRVTTINPPSLILKPVMGQVSALECNFTHTSMTLTNDAQAGNETDSMAGGDMNNELDGSHNVSEIDTSGDENSSYLAPFLSEEAFGSQTEEPAEPQNDIVGDEDTGINMDHGDSAQVQSTAEFDDRLTSRNCPPGPFTSMRSSHSEKCASSPGVAANSLRDVESGERTDNPSCQVTLGSVRKRRRKGGRKEESGDGGDQRMHQDIVNMPFYQDCSVGPETVYLLMLSQCGKSQGLRDILRNLTRLFFGLGSPQGLREFREICLSECPDLRFFDHDLDLPETLERLKQSDTMKWTAKNFRRVGMARVREIHHVKARELQKTMGLRKTRTASTPAYDEPMKDKFPHLANGTKQYMDKLGSLKNNSSSGRHWLALKARIIKGRSLLVLLPQSGPHAVADSM